MCVRMAVALGCGRFSFWATRHGNDFCTLTLCHGQDVTRFRFETSAFRPAGTIPLCLLPTTITKTVGDMTWRLLQDSNPYETVIRRNGCFQVSS
jgi:hypothetical protein